MNNNLKNYKFKKIINLFKKSSIIFFFNSTNLNTPNWLTIDQKLFEYNLKCYRAQNSLTRYILTYSVFSRFINLLNGLSSFVYFNSDSISNFKLDFQKIITLNKKIQLLGLKLNKKVYSYNQLSNLTTLDYKKNVLILKQTFKKSLKTPYIKLKNSK